MRQRRNRSIFAELNFICSNNKQEYEGSESVECQSGTLDICDVTPFEWDSYFSGCTTTKTL